MDPDTTKTICPHSLQHIKSYNRTDEELHRILQPSPERDHNDTHLWNIVKVRSKKPIIESSICVFVSLTMLKYTLSKFTIGHFLWR